MALPRRTFIVGGAHSHFMGKGHPDFIWKRHPDFGKRENPTYDEHLREAVDGCIADTGVDPELIERLFVGNFIGELFVQQGHINAALAGIHPAFANKPAVRTEGACSSGGLAMFSGIDAIAAGADLVLVTGVEIQSTASARTGGDYLARAADYRRQREIDDFTFPALFGRRTKAYREAFGVTEEDIARVSVKAYNNANRNPHAHMHARKVDLAWASTCSDKNPCFLSNEDYKPYIKVSDCSQVTDGASAVLIASEEGLRKLGRSVADTAEIISRANVVSSLFEDGDPTELSTTRVAVQRAYAGAGIGPKDIDVAEVHDCFTMAEMQMYEAAGFAEKGKAAELLRAGVTSLDGELPVNTGGGLIGFGHPVGATGVKQVLEIFRQMKGRCGDYQVDRPLSLGLTANMGGDDKTIVSFVIRNQS